MRILSRVVFLRSSLAAIGNNPYILQVTQIWKKQRENQRNLRMKISFFVITEKIYLVAVNFD